MKPIVIMNRTISSMYTSYWTVLFPKNWAWRPMVL